MKISSIDTNFWNAISPIIRCDEEIMEWRFVPSTKVFILTGAGIEIVIGLEHLNALLYQYSGWMEKNGLSIAGFDGFLEDK